MLSAETKPDQQPHGSSLQTAKEKRHPVHLGTFGDVLLMAVFAQQDELLALSFGRALTLR